MILLIVVVVTVWLAQRLLGVHQAMRFRRQFSGLRRDGRAVAVGAAKRFGRRVYVALAADGEGRVVETMVFSGVTVFAAGHDEPRLRGVPVAALVAGDIPQGTDRLVAEAATQAAGFLTGARERFTASRTTGSRTTKSRTTTSHDPAPLH